MKLKIKILILFILLFSPNSYGNKIKDSVVIILKESKLSLKHKRLLFAQSILETGHFKHVKYNNVFGLKKKKKSKYVLKRFNSLRDCVNSRIKLFVKHKYKIKKSYYNKDLNYIKLLNKIIQKLKKKKHEF